MRAYWLRIIGGLISLVLLPLLTACGGGGGGGGDGGGGGLPPLVYSGNTSPAVITAANASRLTADVFGSGDTAAVITRSSAEGSGATQNQGSGLAHLARRLSRNFRDTVLRANPAQRAAHALVDETEPCDGGNGSIRTFGTLSDVNFTGTLTVNFNNCLIDGDTLSGQATLRVDEFSFAFPQGIPSDSTFSFSNLTIRGPGVSVDAGGSLRDQLNFGTNAETITVNLVTRNNNTGEMTKAENLVFVNVYDNIFSPLSFTETISGRVFDSVHGFVDITTIAPLVFGTINQLFPGSGQMLLTGAGNRSIRLTTLSATLARLALDLNGDSVADNTATLKWTDLSGPVGADLADTDGDGMHNGWETANGLNPNNPTDAALDNDGDGASNLAEYQAGTDPSNPGSMPPVVGLSLSVQDTPDPVVVGGNLSYTIVVTNSSLNAASDVVLTNTLPASVNLTLPLLPTQGSCSGTATITCNFGPLGSFGTASVVISVSPTAEGLISNAASVTTSSLDPNTSDNSATNTTTVGQALTGIQAQILAASNGATIQVPAGIYVGGLDFGGKDITLESIAGPASTIITGNQVPAAQIGPLGAIKGFTIAGGGIQVVGQGTLISGNIFDGNIQVSPIGTAIGGNNASPTVERNIFRNISCDTQFTSGVVAFVNGSSPLIINNIFQNNPCQAINITLPQGNSPQVINNTFVGNRKAVRINVFGSITTHTYRNNIIVSNEIGLDIELTGGPAFDAVWTNNLVFGNTTANYQGTADLTNTNGNISANPMFINGAAGNYRLQPGSPAINAGSSLGAPSVDFDGTLRPINGNWDIGAFEAP